MTLERAAQLVLDYVNANVRARNTYPPSDLIIEQAMRLLAEHVLKGVAK